MGTVTVVFALPLDRIDTTESERKELRQKLVETGATLYGVSSCAYTQRQLADLGTTELFTQGLDYVDCEVEAAYCRQMNVTVYPTWQINGQLYPEYYTRWRSSRRSSRATTRWTASTSISSHTALSGGHDSPSGSSVISSHSASWC